MFVFRVKFLTEICALTAELAVADKPVPVSLFAALWKLVLTPSFPLISSYDSFCSFLHCLNPSGLRRVHAYSDFR